jgi:hypothetical protein
VAGFAKGGAKVNLAEDGIATVLTYAVQAQVGGKLAQVGSRLIDGVARKMANDFFGHFAAAMAPEQTEPAAAAPAPIEATPTAPAARLEPLATEGPLPTPSPQAPAGGMGHRAGRDHHCAALFFHRSRRDPLIAVAP